jgi:hypothetical protein
MPKHPLTETVKQVRNEGGDEIGHLYERVVRWYEQLYVPTPAQLAIAEATHRATVMVHGHGADFDTTFARNMLRFCVVPESHITDERRATYIARAEAGEDVYSYGEVDSPTGIINVWDWDTRIPLFPLVQWTWELDQEHTRYSQIAHQWIVRFEAHIILVSPVGSRAVRDITITIARHMEEDQERYAERAGRVMQMIEGYINLYGDDPNRYDGHHF